MKIVQLLNHSLGRESGLGCPQFWTAVSSTSINMLFQKLKLSFLWDKFPSIQLLCGTVVFNFTGKQLSFFQNIRIILPTAINE